MEEKNGHPFESSVKRFATLGIHPGLVTTIDNSLSPGQYHPKFNNCNYKNTSSWLRKQETEEFSKFLGFRNAKILQDREFRKTQGGPGTYHLNPSEIVASNKSFGCQKRFGTFPNNNPGPGSYRVKETTTKKFNQTPTFEGARFKNPGPSHLLAPNRYKIREEKIFEKIVSKQGPYRTFTGPRDGSTIKNHFAPPSFKPPDIFYEVGGGLDYLLTHPAKFRCGKFNRSERFPENCRILVAKGLSTGLKDPGYPGPGHYEVEDLQSARKQGDETRPFNSSNKHARPPTIWRIHPGPERYSPKLPGCSKKISRPSWMFSSKDQRNFFTIQDFSAF